MCVCAHVYVRVPVCIVCVLVLISYLLYFTKGLQYMMRMMFV